MGSHILYVRHRHLVAGVSSFWRAFTAISCDLRSRSPFIMGTVNTLVSALRASCAISLPEQRTHSNQRAAYIHIVQTVLGDVVGMWPMIAPQSIGNPSLPAFAHLRQSAQAVGNVTLPQCWRITHILDTTTPSRTVYTCYVLPPGLQGTPSVYFFRSSPTLECFLWCAPSLWPLPRIRKPHSLHFAIASPFNGGPGIARSLLLGCP